MTTASNLFSHSKSAARRRILFQFAKTNPSSEAFHKFVSDMRLLMPLPNDLVLEAMSEFNLQQIDIVNNNDSLDDTEMEMEIEASGLQILFDDGSPNLFALYSGDLSDHIISYAATTSDLCTLDLVNSQFRELMTKQWEKRAYERFGMKNGKDGWRMGTSLLREPHCVQLDQTETHGGMLYQGAANVTTNNNELVAVVTDEEMDHTLTAPLGINLYDAKDLTYLGPRDEVPASYGYGEQRPNLWKTIVAGPVGNHLFVSSMPQYCVLFNRGDVYHSRSYPSDGNPDGIPFIATETHVVVVAGNIIKLYKIVSDIRLVELCQSEVLQSEQECQLGEHYQNTIEWGKDESEFVVYHSIRSLDHFSEISIWKLEVEAGTITRTDVIRPEINLILRETVLGEDFIVGSCEFKKIHVWDRHSKEKTQSLLCDDTDEEEDDDIPDEDYIFHPIRMVCHGHMLVTTSHLGIGDYNVEDSICVWNMKTGQLLKKYSYDNVDEKVVDYMTYGDGMIQLVWHI